MSSLVLQFNSLGEDLIADSNVNLNSVSVNQLSVGGVLPGNDKYLTTDNVGALSWINKPVNVSDIRCRSHFTTSGFNFNSAASVNVTFEAATINTLGGDFSFNGTNLFTCNVPGVYRIEYSPIVISSASYNSISIQKNGTNQTLSQINQSGNSCDCICVLNLVATDTINVLSTRIGLNASAKNNLVAIPSNFGPFIITRLQ